MTSEIILVTIPYCTIYYLLYQEFLTICVYPQSIAGLLIVLAILQFNCTYCHHIFIVKLFLISNVKLYFLMHQVLLIVSAITPASASTQFYLFLFTVSVTYQNLLLLSLYYSYQVGFPISYPYQLLLSLQSLYQQLF